MPIAEVNGIRLHYEEYGAGYPVVFLHGFAGTTQAWRPQIPVLSQRYRFIIYDARGHGQSQSPPSPDQYSADIAVEDLYQLLLKLKIPRAVLGGLSMGGYQSLRFSLRHPEMVTALVLMSTGPGYRSPTHMAEWNRQQAKRARLLETEGVAAFAASADTQQNMAYTTREVMLRQNPVGLANMALKVVGQHDAEVIERLGEVRFPTLIVVGENDTPFLGAAQYMGRVLSDARSVTVPKAGHAVNVENPAAFNQAVLSFLDGLHLKTSSGKEKK